MKKTNKSAKISAIVIMALVMIFSLAFSISADAAVEKFKEGTYSTSIEVEAEDISHNKFISPCVVHVDSDGNITADITVKRVKEPKKTPSYTRMGTNGSYSTDVTTDEKNYSQTFKNVPLSHLGEIEIKATTEGMSKPRDIEYDVFISPKNIPLLSGGTVNDVTSATKDDDMDADDHIKKKISEMSVGAAKVLAYEEITDCDDLTKAQKKELKEKLKKAKTSEEVSEILKEAEILDDIEDARGNKVDDFEDKVENAVGVDDDYKTEAEEEMREAIAAGIAIAVCAVVIVVGIVISRRKKK